MNLKKISQVRGFTLIEVLVVIGIIAILAAIVLIAINPAQHFAQARNAQREANVDTILNAIGQNLVANKGTFVCATVVPPVLTTNIGIATGNIDLTNCLSPYLPSGVPIDPDSTATATNTKYTIAATAALRYTVCAPNHVEPAIQGSTTYCITR